MSSRTIEEKVKDKINPHKEIEKEFDKLNINLNEDCYFINLIQRKSIMLRFYLSKNEEILNLINSNINNIDKNKFYSEMDKFHYSIKQTQTKLNPINFDIKSFETDLLDISKLINDLKKQGLNNELR